MRPASRRCAAYILTCILLATAAEAAQEDDVRCLKGVKDSLSDPDGNLDWSFGNSSVGFVCSFNGVSCWNAQENRVLGLDLNSMGLAGPIPSALQYCSASNALDLSGNRISGPIPADLCGWLPYLVTLDLSNNQLTGSIPPELSNCRFLNTLLLAGNKLAGSIPASLTRLERLRKLDLSGNDLSGAIPSPLPATATATAADFGGNADLCGRPLSSCTHRSLSRFSLIIIIAAGILGAAASLLLAYAAWRWFLSPAAKRGRRVPAAEDGRRWVDRLRSTHHRLVPVSLFQKPIVKVKLEDLMAATSDFRSDHIVVAGAAAGGTAYTAVLPDGSALTVKRLCSSRPLNEKQFRAEMGKIGQLRHPNLVPLLGFCIVEDERLLVYKNMPNGALSSAIRALDWPSRRRIGVGAARGLAWLHHGFQIPFLHQCISANSILLDEDFDPRVTDFGLARLARPTDAESFAETSPFMNWDFGEFGYVPPEYATNPVASAKGDVYAFGVVLLELATGQKPTEVSGDPGADETVKGSLVDWVNQLSGNGRIRDSIDKSLRGRGHDEEILQFLKIACGCVVASPMERPSMYRVYNSLKSTGEARNFSEQFDEFPLIYGKDGHESF